MKYYNMKLKSRFQILDQNKELKTAMSIIRQHCNTACSAQAIHNTHYTQHTHTIPHTIQHSHTTTHTIQHTQYRTHTRELCGLNLRTGVRTHHTHDNTHVQNPLWERVISKILKSKNTTIQDKDRPTHHTTPTHPLQPNPPITTPSL